MNSKRWYGIDFIESTCMTIPCQSSLCSCFVGYPSLKRGLSKTTENVEIVTKARDHVLQDINEHDETAHVLETPEFSFVLPDLSKYSEDFRAFLHKDLIETSTLVSLEQAGNVAHSVSFC